jgi:hypothetical protein
LLLNKNFLFSSDSIPMSESSSPNSDFEIDLFQESKNEKLNDFCQKCGQSHSQSSSCPIPSSKQEQEPPAVPKPFEMSKEKREKLEIESHYLNFDWRSAQMPQPIIENRKLIWTFLMGLHPRCINSPIRFLPKPILQHIISFLRLPYLIVCGGVFSGAPTRNLKKKPSSINPIQNFRNNNKLNINGNPKRRRKGNKGGFVNSTNTNNYNNTNNNNNINNNDTDSDDYENTVPIDDKELPVEIVPLIQNFKMSPTEEDDSHAIQASILPVGVPVRFHSCFVRENKLHIACGSRDLTNEYTQSPSLSGILELDFSKPNSPSLKGSTFIGNTQPRRFNCGVVYWQNPKKTEHERIFLFGSGNSDDKSIEVFDSLKKQWEILPPTTTLLRHASYVRAVYLGPIVNLIAVVCHLNYLKDEKCCCKADPNNKSKTCFCRYISIHFFDPIQMCWSPFTHSLSQDLSASLDYFSLVSNYDSQQEKNSSFVICGGVEVDDHHWEDGCPTSDSTTNFICRVDLQMDQNNILSVKLQREIPDMPKSCRLPATLCWKNRLYVIGGSGGSFLFLFYFFNFSLLYFIY